MPLVVGWWEKKIAALGAAEQRGSTARA
jgi:hypothetical protein